MIIAEINEGFTAINNQYEILLNLYKMLYYSAIVIFINEILWLSMCND